MLIEFEILTALAIVLVFLRQRPGVTTVQYAAKHNQVERQRKRAEAARRAEVEFGEQHRSAQFILYKAGGFSLWVAGLCVVIVSAPNEINPKWFDSAITGLGIGMQLVATVLYVFWGILASRNISKAVRTQAGE